MVQYAEKGMQKEVKPHHQEKLIVLRSPAKELFLTITVAATVHNLLNSLSFCYVYGAEVGLVHPGMFKKHTHIHTCSEIPGLKIKCNKLIS